MIPFLATPEEADSRTRAVLSDLDHQHCLQEMRQMGEARDAFHRMLTKKYKDAPTESLPRDDAFRVEGGRWVRLAPSDDLYLKRLEQHYTHAARDLEACQRDLTKRLGLRHNEIDTILQALAQA